VKSINRTTELYRKLKTATPNTKNENPREKEENAGEKLVNIAGISANIAKNEALKLAEKNRKVRFRKKQKIGENSECFKRPEKFTGKIRENIKETPKSAIKTSEKGIKPRTFGLKFKDRFTESAGNSNKINPLKPKVKKQKKYIARVLKPNKKVTKFATNMVTNLVKTITTVKSGAVIAIGGGLALIIVVIVSSFVAAVANSPFGIFFIKNEHKSKFSETISEINSDFNQKIEKIKNENPHDTEGITGQNPNFKEILAVFSVKTSKDLENPENQENASRLCVFDDKSASSLKNFFWENVSISFEIEEKEGEVPKNQENPQNSGENQENKGTKERPKKKHLKITKSRKTLEEMAAFYKFDDKQKEALNELLDTKTNEAWSEILENSKSTINFHGNSNYTWPVPGHNTITAPYGDDFLNGKPRWHTGIDIAAPMGAEIVAADGGEITLASWNGGYGNCVKIKHGSFKETLYGHMSKIVAIQGQMVNQGDVIGYVGSTGNSTGSHLHFETINLGFAYNPLEELR